MSMADDYQELERFKKHLQRLKDNLEWLLPRLEGFKYTPPDYESMWREEETIKLEELLIEATKFDDANGGHNIYNGRFSQARDIADQLENGFWRWGFEFLSGYQGACRDKGEND